MGGIYWALISWVWTIWWRTEHLHILQWVAFMTMGQCWHHQLQITFNCWPLFPKWPSKKVIFHGCFPSHRKGGLLDYHLLYYYYCLIAYTSQVGGTGNGRQGWRSGKGCVCEFSGIIGISNFRVSHEIPNSMGLNWSMASMGRMIWMSLHSQDIAPTLMMYYTTPQLFAS